MKRSFLNTLAAVALCALAGCSSLTSTYVAADRQNYKAIAPLLQQLKQFRPAISQDIDNKLRSWDIRLTEAEKATVVP
jgi:hypothetical protein